MRIVDPGGKSISRPRSQCEMHPSPLAEDASIPNCPALGIFSAVVMRNGSSFTSISGLKVEIQYS
jgi:hypothetical protein